jgi:glc operon protein GlcG
VKFVPVLTLDDVSICVDAARRTLAAQGRSGTIVLVDRSGAPVYLERPDNQGPNSVDMALGKARAAAFRERTSADLEDKVKARPGFLMTPNQIGVRGGIPLFFRGECVGGIAVSGVDKLDEPAAAAGAAALESVWKDLKDDDSRGERA